MIFKAPIETRYLQGLIIWFKFTFLCSFRVNRKEKLKNFLDDSLIVAE